MIIESICGGVCIGILLFKMKKDFELYKRMKSLDQMSREDRLLYIVFQKQNGKK